MYRSVCWVDRSVYLAPDTHLYIPTYIYTCEPFQIDKCVRTGYMDMSISPHNNWIDMYIKHR